MRQRVDCAILKDLSLLDFAVNRRPFLFKNRQAVFGARSPHNTAALQHPVNGILHICIGVEL